MKDKTKTNREIEGNKDESLPTTTYVQGIFKNYLNKLNTVILLNSKLKQITTHHCSEFIVEIYS